MRSAGTDPERMLARPSLRHSFAGGSVLVLASDTIETPLTVPEWPGLRRAARNRVITITHPVQCGNSGGAVQTGHGIHAASRPLRFRAALRHAAIPSMGRRTGWA